jgi:ribosomal protein S18 acetylase RimI-like enzyme
MKLSSRFEEPMPPRECVDLTIEDVRRVRRIPSGYTTDRVYILRRSLRTHEFIWTLVLAETKPYTKTYDRGDPKEWLDPYFHEIPREKTRYLGFQGDTEIDGLLSYAEVEWNNTLWLFDIRVREERRRRGAGSAMLADLQARAREEMVRGITVETQINNVPAIDFYRKHGFEISGFNDHLYENDDLDRQDVGLFLFWETA